MKTLIGSIRIYIFFTILLGLAYPLLMTGLAQVLFPYQANGSLIVENNKVLGSALIAQKFSKAEYFFARPSATDYSSMPSGGSNLGPTNSALLTTMQEREYLLKSMDPEKQITVPGELVFASASGLDPHISPEAAYYQVPRIAAARSLSTEDVKEIIASLTRPRQLGILGERTVNVLEMNLALDRKGKLAQSLDSVSTKENN